MGVALAYVVEGLLRLLRRLDIGDTQIDNLIVLIAPYVTYFSAEALGGSGVLATVDDRHHSRPAQLRSTRARKRASSRAPCGTS